MLAKFTHILRYWDDLMPWATTMEATMTFICLHGQLYSLSWMLLSLLNSGLKIQKALKLYEDHSSNNKQVIKDNLNNFEHGVWPFVNIIWEVFHSVLFEAGLKRQREVCEHEWLYTYIITDRCSVLTCSAASLLPLYVSRCSCNSSTLNFNVSNSPQETSCSTHTQTNVQY